MDGTPVTAELVFGLIFTKYAQAAALVFMLCDAAHTLDDEIKYVWLKSRSFGKLLYITNRYFGILSIIVKVVVASGRLESKISTCVKFNLWWYIDFTIVVAVAEVILMLRVYAVYERNRKLGIALLVMTFFEVAGTACLEVFQHTSSPLKTPIITIVSSRLNDFSGCYVVLSKRSFAIWILPLFSEITLCLLMLYKAWVFYRAGWSNTILTQLIKDSVAYFSAQGCVFILHCFFWVYAAGDQMAMTATGVILSSVASPWAVVVSSVLGTRLLLGIRKTHFHTAVHNGTTQDDNIWTTGCNVSTDFETRMP